MACNLVDETGLNFSVKGRIIVNALANYLIENGGAIGTDTVRACYYGSWGQAVAGQYCSNGTIWQMSINGAGTGEFMQFPILLQSCSAIYDACNNDDSCCATRGFEGDSPLCVAIDCRFESSDLDSLPVNNQGVIKEGTCLKIDVGATYTPDDSLDPPIITDFNCNILCQISAMNDLSGTQADLKTLLNNILNALCCNVARFPKVLINFDTSFVSGGTVRVYFIYNQIPFCADYYCKYWDFDISNFASTDVAFALKTLDILNSLHSDMIKTLLEGFNANINDGRETEKYIKQSFLLKYIKADNFPSVFDVSLIDGNEEI